MKLKLSAIYCYVIFLLFSPFIYSQKKPMTFVDAMQFRQINEPTISTYGNWIVYKSKPDRGNADLVIQSTETETEYEFERGAKPKISENEKWVGFIIEQDYLDKEKKKKNYKSNFVLLNTESGDTLLFEEVKKFDFSEDSKWLSLKHYSNTIKDTSKEKPRKKKLGSLLYLYNLENKKNNSIQWVVNTAFDSLSNYFAYSVNDTNSSKGLYLFDLSENQTVTVDKDSAAYYTNLTWHKSGKLAFVKSYLDEDEETSEADLYLWNGSVKKIASSKDAKEGWMIPAKNNLHWTEDGERLFFGYKPEVEKREKDTTEAGLYDVDRILEDIEGNVWHWKDPRIKTNEIKEWKNVKDQTFAAVYHFDDNSIVQLCDKDVPFIRYSDNPDYAFAYTNVPYLWESTWESTKYDNYVINLKTGKRIEAAVEQRENGRISPTGKYLLYYKLPHWYLFDIEKNKTTNLTEKLDVQFSNEDHDRPIEAYSYGFGGWIDKDKALLIYDKFDIWKFNSKDGIAENLTNGFGRENKYQFRIKKLDKNKKYFENDKTVLLSAYHDMKKFTALYSLNLKSKKLSKHIEKNKIVTLIAKAEKADKTLFTKESFDLFPDLWLKGEEFTDVKKLTNFQEQVEKFKWGKPELIEWLNIDGVPIQGVVFKPDNYDPNKRYPVFIYYYRFFSPRMYEFPDVVVNHRPNIPVFLGDDYVVFYPDIKFEIGRPGYSATKSLVPGVQKLIELGIADPDAIGLHGHSWSGYQTAFVVTQTDIFKCAVAGAVVSNMTSAYSGIRWGSGLARQFQYEKTQSRIGGSLWEYPERYIENSPVFFADKINTPILIQHGDEDEAVPWYQGIEYYLALRRLGKDVIFLHYKGEPHWLGKYPNKLDYSIKMKEYMDYHLKGTPAPDWIINGVPYKGE